MLNWFSISSFLRSIQVLSDIIIFSFFEGGPSVTGAAPLLAVIWWNGFVIVPWRWYFLACVAISRRSPHHYKLHSMNLNLNIERSKCWRIQPRFRFRLQRHWYSIISTTKKRLRVTFFLVFRPFRLSPQLCPRENGDPLIALARSSNRYITLLCGHITLPCSKLGFQSLSVAIEVEWMYPLEKLMEEEAGSTILSCSSRLSQVTI